LDQIDSLLQDKPQEEDGDDGIKILISQKDQKMIEKRREEEKQLEQQEAEILEKNY